MLKVEAVHKTNMVGANNRGESRAKKQGSELFEVAILYRT